MSHPATALITPRLRFRSLVALLWLWLTAVSSAALAQDHIVERAWLEDPHGTLDWPQVQQHSTTPFQGTLTKGFGHSVIWLRLRIAPQTQPVSAPSQGRLILRIRPVYLDDIRVYDPLEPSGLVGVTGDTHHPALDEFRGLDFLVPIARGTQPRDVWLRVSSTSTRQMDVQALTIDTLNRRIHTQSLVFSGYVGLVTILTVWGFASWFFSRETVMGAFGIMQTGALLFALATLGHLRVIWPQEWPGWLLHNATTVFSVTAVSAAEWFHVKLVRELDPPRWIRRIHQALMGLLPVKLLLLTLGLTTAALRLNMVEIPISAAVFMVSTALARGWNHDLKHQPVLSRQVMVGFYGLLLVVLMGAALPALGVTQSSEVALYVVQLHGLVTAFLVFLMLQYRSHGITRQQREIALALERSLLQTQQERTIREEQEKLLTMLAHELKTPLATMHMRLDNQAPGAREIRQAIRDMNNVLDRCQQTLQLSDKQLLPHIETVDMARIVTQAVSACQYPERMQLDLPDQVFAQADQQLCFIVLNNLLENACKYAAPNTPIQIRLTAPRPNAEDSFIKLEITNHPGQAGWPDASQVFDRYYRSPHARRQAGSGLGLFLVKNLLQTMQGCILYIPDESLLRFEVRLPGAASQALLNRR